MVWCSGESRNARFVSSHEVRETVSRCFPYRCTCTVIPAIPDIPTIVDMCVFSNLQKTKGSA